MGLDRVVEGCAKPGHETEWRRILERSFANEKVSEAEIARSGRWFIFWGERGHAIRAYF